MNKKDKLVLSFLGFLVIVAFFGGQMWNSYKDFSKEKWVNYEGNSRQAIVKDFFDRTIIDGISEEELKSYLGEPDDRNDAEMIYYLGTPRSFFGDKEGPEEQLVFTFQDGKAIGVTRVPVSAQVTE